MVNAIKAFCVILPMLALIQWIWTWRIARRVERWLSDPEALVRGGAYHRFSGIALPIWLATGLLGVGVLFLVLMSPRTVAEEDSVVAMGLALTFGSSLMVLISVLALRACAACERYSVVRTFDGDAPIPEEVSGLVSPRILSPKELGRLVLQRWETLASIVRICLWVIGIFVGIALCCGLMLIFSSAIGSLSLLGLVIIIPGLFVLLFARWAVFAKAQRAQFLWFLALTVEKQRTLAPELRQWALARPGRFGARVMEAARDLAAGDSLSDALAGRDLVAKSELLSIRVGETTGQLAHILRDAAVRQTNSLSYESLAGTSFGPILYFSSLSLVAFNILMFLMYYIVPKFKAIFWGFGTELPGITVMLIQLSDFVVTYFYLFFWAPLLAMFLIWSCGEAYFKGWSETWLAWLVGVGRKAEVPRLLRRLREAVIGKVPWEQVIRPLVLFHHREPIRVRMERVLGRITAGMSMWPAMRDSGLLTSRDVTLLEMAERANNLPWTLAALADAKERSLAHRWQMIVTLLMPIGILIGGFCVLFICVGFFMPLVKLLNDLS